MRNFESFVILAISVLLVAAVSSCQTFSRTPHIAYSEFRGASGRYSNDDVLRVSQDKPESVELQADSQLISDDALMRDSDSAERILPAPEISSATVAVADVLESSDSQDSPMPLVIDLAAAADPPAREAREVFETPEVPEMPEIYMISVSPERVVGAGSELEAVTAAAPEPVRESATAITLGSARESETAIAPEPVVEIIPESVRETAPALESENETASVEISLAADPVGPENDVVLASPEMQPPEIAAVPDDVLEDEPPAGIASAEDFGAVLAANAPAEAPQADAPVLSQPAAKSSDYAETNAVARERKRLKYLFVPTAYSPFEGNALTSAIVDYALNFNIDLIVITGSRSRVLPIINGFSQEKYPTTMIIQNGIVICNQDFLSRSGGYIEFNDFAVQLYQGEIKGSRFDSSAALKEPASYRSEAFEKLRSADKPSLVFASPFETSYYDAAILPSAALGEIVAPVSGSFVQSFEENGYVDAYNSIRYSAPTIGSAHPGFTYGDENGNFRIDFVFFKGMLPASADTYYISGLSDLQTVRRYAIMGEVAI